jgi:hypothetical protein
MDGIMPLVTRLSVLDVGYSDCGRDLGWVWWELEEIDCLAGACYVGALLAFVVARDLGEEWKIWVKY